MKGKAVVVLSTVLVAFLFLNYRFVNGPAPGELITKSYREGLQTFAASIKIMQDSAELYRGNKKQLDNLKSQFVKIRYSYKRIECFSAYLDYYSTGYLNGPNLPKIEYEQNEPPKVDEPFGLQVLEEVLYSDVPPTKDALIKVLANMNFGVRTLKSQTGSLVLHDNHIFDAFRHQLLRILALGITGFDSPVSLNSLQETSSALTALKFYYSFYQQSIQEKSKNRFQETNKIFDNALKHINSTKNFDRFDRAYFTRTFLDPLLKSFKETAEVLKISPVDKEFPNDYPVRSQATHLFSANLINPYFFHAKQNATSKPEIVELGRILFFDPIISGNNQRSCASCHNPDRAFTDGETTNFGLDHTMKLQRNTPTLINVAFQQKFQLDARAFHMEDQFAHVMFSASELGETATGFQAKLNESNEYKALFKKAFNMSEKQHVTFDLAFIAIGAYVRSLTAFNSPFDKYMRREQKEIQPEVLRGFNLFMGKAKCGTCHFAPVFNGTLPPDFTNTETEVLGVTQSSDFNKPILDGDVGRYVIAAIDDHRNSFKTPTLRNIALTAPYMHNGAFKTLEEVMEFYNKGGGKGLGLDVPNQTLPSDPLNLNKQEIKDIIAFMKSLTDTSGLTKRPKKLPKFENDLIDARKVGGTY